MRLRWCWPILLAVGCREGGAAPIAELDAPAASEGAASGPPPPATANASAMPPGPAGTTPPAGCKEACGPLRRCDGARCVSACPSGEVYVPATRPEGFLMGRGKPGEPDQAHRVVLTRPFCMDSTEVTVAAYRVCLERGACTLPQLRDANSNYRPERRRDDHPVNMVNWSQARAYCAAHGKLLPTEAQFEWAAGAGQRRYPWGDEPEPTCENGLADFTPEGSPKTDPAGDYGCHGGGTSPVRAHPRGAARWPDGDLFDLAGNVWEWTRDCYLPYPAEEQRDPSPQAHPHLRGDCYVRALRGGGWNRSKAALVTWRRAGSKKTYRVPGLGFRCVREE